MDYVVFYAEMMQRDNRYFKQQKMLIDSQIQASRSLYMNMFKKHGTADDFKKSARDYLRQLGII